MSVSKKYDFAIIGAGLTGSTIARELTNAGKKCVVVEKRKNIAGNIYTEKTDGIDVHLYGAHIFHTNNYAVWEYVNKFVRMNRFINSPIANFQGKLYNLPFNMNTFYQMWGVKTPNDAIQIIEMQRKKIGNKKPQNLEEQAIQLVGTDIYERLIEGYTQKQWGRNCKELPPEIIMRLPVRFTFDNNYYNSAFQGIPEEGYTTFVKKLLEGSYVILGTDYFDYRSVIDTLAEKIIYTGCIDKYFDFCYGKLAYRNVRFDIERLDMPNYQGNAVINFTDIDVPYTRIIEHKHFAFGTQPTTIISKEYSCECTEETEPCYPINDTKNNTIYEKYEKLSKDETKTIFCGRLAQYKYIDMDKAIENAIETSKQILSKGETQ